MIAKTRKPMSAKGWIGPFDFAAQSERHLYGRAEQTVVVGDRFTGMNADANPRAFAGHILKRRRTCRS
jgi:hypothetical protein